MANMLNALDIYYFFESPGKFLKNVMSTRPSVVYTHVQAV
jgi:hypothetical protein